MANADKEKVREIRRKRRTIVKKKIKKLLKPIKVLKQKFEDMNKSTKAIILVWVVVLLVIVFLSLLVSLSNSNRVKYYEMEEKLYEGTLAYVTAENVYPTSDNKAYIPVESLILDGYVKKKDFTDTVDKDKDGSNDLCKAYSIVYYNGDEEQYSIESFVSCNKYTSKYFNDYLDYLEK